MYGERNVLEMQRYTSYSGVIQVFMSKAEKTFPVNSIHRLRPLSFYFGRIMFLALRMGNKMNIPISSLLSTPSHADIVLEFLC